MHISILIPAFNHAKYITDLLISLRADEEIIGEIIIIDDASSDNTFDVVKNYCKDNEKITILRNAKNVGISNNLNKLISLAKCDYIALIASDDLSIPGSLKKKLKFLENADNCNIVFTDCEVINDDDKIFCKSGLTKLYDMNLLAMKSGRDELHRELILNWGVPGSTLMIRRQFFDNFRFKTWSHLDDLDLFMHAVNQHCICYYDIKSTQYRQHSGSARKSLSRRVSMKFTFLILFLYYFVIGKPHLRKLLIELFAKRFFGDAN
jgi:glycosyltransferase involved in cell wall biosynthesis